MEQENKEGYECDMRKEAKAYEEMIKENISAIENFDYRAVVKVDHSYV